MAKTVFEVEEVTLLDGETVELKPLNIKMLRKFSKMLKNFFETVNGEDAGENEEDEDVALEALLDMAAFCVSRTHSQYSKNKDEREEAFDIDTVYYIIEKCTGTKLKADPEEMRRLMEQVQTSEAKTVPGTT